MSNVPRGVAGGTGLAGAEVAAGLVGVTLQEWDVSQLPVAPAARVSGFGRVVSAGRVWFAPPLPTSPLRYAPPRESAPKPSRMAVPVHGVDLAGLLNPREQDGALEGWAAVTGVWRDDGLTVAAQSTLRPPHGLQPPSRTVPPCAAPAAGWPGGDTLNGLDAELAALTASGLVMQVTMFSPPHAGQVPAISATDPELVEGRLRRVCGQRLCVVRSRYSPDQVEAVQADIHRHFQDWQTYASGLSSGEDGQIVVTLSLVRVTPDVAAWAEQVPGGLLAVDPCRVILPGG